MDRHERGIIEKPIERGADGEMYLGSVIRMFRQEREITDKELAQLVGVHASLLSNIELNKRRPSKTVLQKISLELGLVEEELLQIPPHPRTQHQTSSTESKLSQRDTSPLEVKLETMMAEAKLSLVERKFVEGVVFDVAQSVIDRLKDPKQNT